ncbi:MAG TPA: hypothetical protein VK694_01295 [Verrucomicrobiae bacterium]|nr:hypothetical protein [Verrucomicrobiae bacterium]
MSDTSSVPAVASAKAVTTRKNSYWWIVAIVAIVAVAVIAGICIVRGMRFSGQFVVGSKSWYGSKVYVGCQ